MTSSRGSRARVHLGHANARVGEGQGVVALVRGDVDEEVLLALEQLGVGQTLMADLVQSIGRVGDKLAKEDLFVRVELRERAE